MKKGMVVISKSGRDKGHFFVVVKAYDECAYIADGKLRKIGNLKKKTSGMTVGDMLPTAMD